MHLNGDYEKYEKNSCSGLKYVPSSLFMLLNLKPQAYAWPIIVFCKHDSAQLHDKCSKEMSLACKTFVKIYFKTLGISLFLKPMPEVRVKVSQKCMRHFSTPKYIYTPIGIPTSINIQIFSGFNFSRTEARGHSDPEKVGDTPRPLMYPHSKFWTFT